MSLETFDRDGYVVVRGLLSPGEVRLLSEIGRVGGEVYHYHHTMILKQKRTGGAWAWRQDYGYWDSNGCLQVLAGSHQMGRIDHVTVGEQTGADPERMEHILPKFERVYVELEPGGAVFFHSNLLHRSDRNPSEQPRWAFIRCYNAARNNPYKKHRHPGYEPLEVWPHERAAEVGLLNGEGLQSSASQLVAHIRSAFTPRSHRYRRRARKGAGPCRPSDEHPAPSRARHGTRSIMYKACDPDR